MRVLVCGAFGYGNLGDDANAICEERWLQARGHQTRHTSPPFMAAEVEWAEAVVIGGGGILYDGCMDNVHNYLAYAEAAVAQGKPFAVCNAGTQGIRTPEGRRAYREVLSKAAAISVRDPYDAYVLQVEVGLDREVLVGEDSAWLGRYMPEQPLTEEWGLGVRTYNPSDMTCESPMYPAVMELARERSVKAYVFSLEDDPGLRGMRRVCASTLERLAACFTCRRMVVTRFHALIAAIAAGVAPVIGIGGWRSWGKIERFAKRWRLPGMFDPYGADRAVVERKLAGEVATAARLAEIRERCREGAEAGMRYVERGLLRR